MKYNLAQEKQSIQGLQVHGIWLCLRRPPGEILVDRCWSDRCVFDWMRYVIPDQNKLKKP